MGDTPLPPFPTNDGGLGASDFVGNVPEYSPASELDDTLAWTQGNVLGVGQADAEFGEFAGRREGWGVLVSVSFHRRFYLSGSSPTRRTSRWYWSGCR